MSKKKDDHNKVDHVSYDAEYGEQMLRNLPDISEPMANVLTIHLLCEYAMNAILYQTWKGDKSRFQNMKFFVKIEMLYQLSVIPDYVYKNLQTLNMIRNGYAHDIKYHLFVTDFELFEPQFILAFNQSTLLKSAGPKVKYNSEILRLMESYLATLVYVTFVQLHNIILEKFPKPNRTAKPIKQEFSSGGKVLNPK